MKKSITIWFYVLSVYVIVQFIWWGFHIIDLTNKINGDTPNGFRRIVMIVGEGTVFLAILVFGIWSIRKYIKRELEFSRNQNNFLLSVTHELKTPIASSKLYLQTLQKRNMDEQKREEIIHKVLLQNDQLERLIDNILNATRLESKRLVLHKEELNVSTFLTRIFERYERQYVNHVFISKIKPNISDEVDPFIFETIVNNLIENAIKYGGDPAEITIELERDEQLVVRIADKGFGVEMAAQKMIFKKFYRVGNEETRTQKGSGLGLFIVSELAKLHKGQVRYYPNEPKGSIFEVRF